MVKKQKRAAKAPRKKAKPKVKAVRAAAAPAPAGDLAAQLTALAASARQIADIASSLLPMVEAAQQDEPPALERGAAPMVMTRGQSDEARKRVEDRWGKAFASKCSRALVERLTAPARETGAGVGLSASGVVLEFNEQPADAILPERASSRTQRLASKRDAFYRMASPVRAAVERAAASALAPAVQICWLNCTMRIVGQVPSMAEVAHHQQLQLLDVSRVLRREMNICGATVHADAPRTNFGVTGNGVRVAVIDGEVNVNHPAFGGRAMLQENLTSEPFGTPDPHGTAVAGIICAADASFSGVAPGALVMNYKVFPTGSRLADEFQGILALEHALRDGADIANCSWGTGLAGDGINREARAFNRAWREGLVIVKSAGNDGPGAGSMSAPADADGVIVVGATEREGTAVQNYSSRGPTLNGKHPHLVAPGGTPQINVMTCLPTGGFGNSGHGTSLAAPIVSGAAALLTERFPTETADQIRDRLLNMCRSLGADVNASGAGLLDLSLFNPA